MRPEPLHGFGACFSLAQGWFARRGAGRVYVPLCLRAVALLSCKVYPQRAGIISRRVPGRLFRWSRIARYPKVPGIFRATAGGSRGILRWWCAGAAKPLGLSGYAENLDDGRVKVIAQGSRASCERLLETLNSGDTAGHVDFVDASFTEPQGTFKGFGTR